MKDDMRDRPEELLMLARAAEKRADMAGDEDMRRAWLRVAQEWRSLAERVRRIGKL